MAQPLRDTPFLAHATRLAQRHQGRCWPNPSVGCVLVKNNQVIAAAVTAEGGRPHAETQALHGVDAHGATAYVTLEPCAHHGKTPPCAQALIDAGVTRVVYACEDADPRVAGKGAAMLRTAGIEAVHVPFAPAEAQHRGFLRRMQHGLPEVLMKLATSADGAMRDPASPFITGPQARAHGHALRTQVDAVLTGIGTVVADNPRLDVRLSGITRPNLARVVCDRHLRLPLDRHIVRTAHQQPTWVITTAEAVELTASHATDLREAGVVIHVVEAPALHPQTVLELLADEGIGRVLVEAGAALCSAFLEAQCVDHLYWYEAPTYLVTQENPVSPALLPHLERLRKTPSCAQFSLGDDRCAVYELASCLPDSYAPPAKSAG